MARLAKKTDPGFAQRLKIAIRETGLTQGDFAASIQTTGHNVSRWVTGVQAPDAPGMAKLAHGLQARFIWVLTGEESADMEIRQVGSLPEKLRELITRADHLGVDDQETLAAVAHILEERPRNPKLVGALVDHVEGVALAMEMGRQGRARPPSTTVITSA